MRLIDADAMKEMISAVIKKQNGKDNDLVPIKELNIFIDEQPTVVDSDNLCEWKWGIGYAQVECKGDKILFDSRRLFNYCPYCGKKIKEVE